MPKVHAWFILELRMAEAIAWSNILGMTQIASDYVGGRKEVVNLLGGDWRKKSTRKSVGERRNSFNFQPGLGSAIKKSYGKTTIPEVVEKNLSALDSPNTLAIVTGQQLGLFGGPLYTLYKALTTIFLARKLQDETKSKVVPIFWMETSDADFKEVNQVAFPSDQIQPRSHIYMPKDVVTGHIAGHHKLTPAIIEAQDDVFEWMKSLPLKRKFADILQDCYQPGVRVVDAFRDNFTQILGDMGLVMFDAIDPNIRSFSAEFWTKSLALSENLNNAYSVSSNEVKALRVPLQVRLRDNTMPIFRIDKNDKRHRIRRAEGGWKLGTKQKIYSTIELINLVEDNSGTFSPAVLLRPLLQDWLLPTWIYVAGPSEISYHAQIGRAYDQLKIPRPLLAPRLSATLIEKPARRMLNKHNWKVAEVFGGRELLLRTKGSGQSLREMFENGASHLDGLLTRIGAGAEDSGINISLELDLATRKLTFQWDKLRTITVRKLGERDKTRFSHSEKLYFRLLRRKILQERHDNMLHYLASYGDRLFHAIDASADVFEPKHLIIDLEQDL